MSENEVRGVSPWREAIAVLNRHRFFPLYTLFALIWISTVLYYFGELVDVAGWEQLRWDFFYGVHDIQRLVFFIPIVFAGYFFRVKGALIVTFVSFVVFLPRAVMISPFPVPMLRVVLFAAIAGVMGFLTAVARNEYENRGRLERLVARERDNLLGILERMEDGVLIVGSDYIIRFMNPSMVRDFGSGMNSYCYTHLHGFDEPCRGICRLPGVINGATERWEYTLPDGTTYEVVASPLLSADGETCQLAIFRNMTQRKKVEMELVEVSRLKSELLSNVSHELRSPLSSIKGIATSLLQKDITLDTGTTEMLLTGISEEVDRLASLVTNLLNMSKLEAGVWKPEKERCYIADIIDDVLERQKWVHQKHSLVADIEPGIPEIYADYSQMRQVLLNLVENATAYSEEGTQVRVAARTVDGTVHVSVTDQGVGIRRKDLERIFEKFYRGTEERARPGGTGLGLAICQAVVRAHGGRIWAESEIGHGSTFHFTVPVAPPAGKGKQVPDDQEDQSPGR